MLKKYKNKEKTPTIIIDDKYLTIYPKESFTLRDKK